MPNILLMISISCWTFGKKQAFIRISPVIVLFFSGFVDPPPEVVLYARNRFLGPSKLQCYDVIVHGNIFIIVGV